MKFNILTSKTLKLWEKLIDHPYFIRYHRSYLVNTKYVGQFNLKSNSLFINEQCIPISRDRKSACLTMIF
ncbi:MAG: LytTR family transcriptional regulator [Saprospiraceae bacterium]|nr:LytTR family transcriptional regulator [Saprospiraceae bacterium]